MLRFVNSNGTLLRKEEKEIKVDITKVSECFSYIPKGQSAGVRLDESEIFFHEEDGLPLFVINHKTCGTTTGMIVRNEKDKNTLIKKAESNDYDSKLINLYKSVDYNSIIYATDYKEEVALADIIEFLQMLTLSAS